MDFLEQKTVLTHLIACLLSSILIYSCDNKNKYLPYYNSPDFTPIFLNNSKEIKEKITHKISDFEFRNQSNEIITHDSINGKVHIANFIFTSCINICPNMTSNMKIVENEFINDPRVQILSFSVMPWVDDIKKLNDYKNYHEINSNNWHFLTGEKNKIYKLARESYFAEENIGFSSDLSDFLHTEYFILVDQGKRIRGIYNGTLRLEAIQLIDDIKTLLNNENWSNI